MISAGTSNKVETRAATHVYGGYVWVISFAGALGGLLFGYDWVVIGGAKPFYEKFFHLNSASQQGWAMSCALIGCLLGALVSGGFCDKFGRKPMLIAAALVFGISSIGTATAGTFTIFEVWRMMGGLAIGLASSLSPMYIAEVSPAHLRGQLVSLNQLTIVIGILLAQAVNWTIARPVPADATGAADSRIVEWPGGLAVDVWRNRCTFRAFLCCHGIGS